MNGLADVALRKMCAARDLTEHPNILQPNSVSNMETLPHDLLVKIFSQLSVNEIVLCSCASKAFYSQNYEDIWMTKCAEFGIKFEVSGSCGDLIKSR
jgi:hypothetical protein